MGADDYFNPNRDNTQGKGKIVSSRESKREYPTSIFNRNGVDFSITRNGNTFSVAFDDLPDEETVTFTGSPDEFRLVMESFVDYPHGEISSQKAKDLVYWGGLMVDQLKRGKENDPEATALAGEINLDMENGENAYQYVDKFRLLPNPIVVDLNNVIANNPTSDDPDLRINPLARLSLHILRNSGTVVITTAASDWKAVRDFLKNEGVWTEEMVLMTRENYAMPQDRNITEGIVDEFHASLQGRLAIFESPSKDAVKQVRWNIGSGGKRLGPLFQSESKVPIIEDDATVGKYNVGMDPYIIKLFAPKSYEEGINNDRRLDLFDAAMNVRSYYGWRRDEQKVDRQVDRHINRMDHRRKQEFYQALPELSLENIPDHMGVSMEDHRGSEKIIKLLREAIVEAIRDPDWLLSDQMRRNWRSEDQNYSKTGPQNLDSFMQEEIVRLAQESDEELYDLAAKIIEVGSSGFASGESDILMRAYELIAQKYPNFAFVRGSEFKPPDTFGGIDFSPHIPDIAFRHYLRSYFGERKMPVLTIVSYKEVVDNYKRGRLSIGTEGSWMRHSLEIHRAKPIRIGKTYRLPRSEEAIQAIQDKIKHGSVPSGDLSLF